MSFSCNTFGCVSIIAVLVPFLKAFHGSPTANGKHGKSPSIVHREKKFAINKIDPRKRTKYKRYFPKYK